MTNITDERLREAWKSIKTDGVVFNTGDVCLIEAALAELAELRNANQWRPCYDEANDEIKAPINEKVLLGWWHTITNQWRGMESAPKTGQPLLLRFKKDLHLLRSDLDYWSGLIAVMRHSGSTITGWGFAAPVGNGGFPDEWFEGWQPLPPPPSKESSHE